MGIEIGAQLDALWRSLFLGAAFALLYDGLRALRLRRRTRRALTDLLDALYCLFLAAALLAFTLRIGQGELRLYMLAFIALGAYLSFALLSPLLTRFGTSGPTVSLPSPVFCARRFCW